MAVLFGDPVELTFEHAMSGGEKIMPEEIENVEEQPGK
jgi:hypothetical protein